MIGNLPSSEIENLLKTHQIGRLGITDGDRVYVFPVVYGYDGTFVYVHSRDGLKVQLMRAHAEVCFEIEEIESPASWRTVVAHGVFEEMSDEGDERVAMVAIACQGATQIPMSIAPYLDGPDNVIFYRIRLTEKSGRFEHDPVFARNAVR